MLVLTLLRPIDVETKLLQGFLLLATKPISSLFNCWKPCHQLLAYMGKKKQDSDST